MAFIDYYKILGVDRNIPQDQVREAYRKRAKQFHPDLQVEEALLSRVSTSRDSELERVASQVSSRTFLEPRQVVHHAHATAHARIVAR